MAAYFAYSWRIVNGLGITTDGDVLSESPSDQRSILVHWRHR